ncbi:MAG: GNAT family N-acetyltransferase [Planctomycetota bacterium]|nr:GNAT family N-acetyltransferase [Planctomycetota bacterium]
MVDGAARIRPLDAASESDVLVPLDRLVNGERPAAEVVAFYRAYAGLILIAEVDEEVVGYATLSGPYWNRILMMDHLAVVEAARKQGLGRLLCDAIEAAARDRGARFLTVQTARWNADAIRFYERVGFTQRGVFPDYMGDDNDLVWLDKRLSS